MSDWDKEVSSLPSYPGVLRGYREFLPSVAKAGRKNDKGNLPYEFLSINSAHRYTVSRNGWAVAKCAYKKEHPSPDGECSCGFYVSYVPGESFYGEDNRSTKAYAVVETSGKIVLSTKGFRAEKMRILAYYLPDKMKNFYSDYDPIGYLAKVKKYDNRQEMFLDFPQENLSALLGKENFLKCLESAAMSEGAFLKYSAKPDPYANTWTTYSSSTNQLSINANYAYQNPAGNISSYGTFSNPCTCAQCTPQSRWEMTVQGKYGVYYNFRKANSGELVYIQQADPGEATFNSVGWHFAVKDVYGAYRQLHPDEVEVIYPSTYSNAYSLYGSGLSNPVQAGLEVFPLKGYQGPLRFY